MGSFPIATAQDIVCSDNIRLQEKIDNGTLGGGGDSTATTLTQEEYDALDPQEQLEGEFYCYDSARHFRNGVEYGKAVDISGKQDDLNKIKFTMRRNGVNEPRYCLIGTSDLNQTILMNEPYIFEGVFGSNTSSDKKSIITLSVSFKNGADKDNIFRGYADCADGFQYVDLVVTVDEENMAYAYVDFKQESSLATGSIRVPSINTEYYMDLETEFVLVDSMQGTELCRMSDYAKIITNIDDVNDPSETSVWSSQKTSDEIADIEDALKDKADKTELNKRREIRVGEIYDSNSYYRVDAIGHYARPLYFRVVSTNGGEEILSFGQSVTSERKVIGKSVNATFKYIPPTLNATNGTLFIKTNKADTSVTIFYTQIYSVASIPTLRDSTAEEYATGTDFNVQELATMDSVVQCVENKKPNAKTVSFELNSEEWNCGTIYGNTNNGGNFKYDYYVNYSGDIGLVKQDVYGHQGSITASLSGTTLTLTASGNTTIKTVTIIKS